MKYRIGIAVVMVLACGSTRAEERGAPIPIAEVAHIHGIGFDAANPGHVFLATHFGVYRTTGDGMAAQVSQETNDYMGFSTHPTDPSLLLASGHPANGGNMGVIVSHNGGVTWEQVASGVNGPVDFHAMTISRADPNVIYGLFGGIQLSRDGGITWTVTGPGPDRVIDLAASATKVDTLYAGTAAGLWISDDAGVSWSLRGPGDVPVTMVEAAPDGGLYAFLAGEGLFRQAPEGNWSILADDLGSRDFLHLAIDPSDASHLVAVTQQSEILESRDGGKTWAPLAS